MNFPDNLKYTKDHEWVKAEEDNTAFIGITEFAQGELGDVVFVEVDTVGELLSKETIFGTVEAVKTVSDLFMPLTGEVLEVNPDLQKHPEYVNKDPYGKGWMIKVKCAEPAQLSELLSADEYKNLIGINS